MVNSETIKALNLTPGQAAAIAIFGSVYGNKPQTIKSVLEKHRQNYTGNPNVDFFQVAQLSKERKRFFDEDFEIALKDAKYFSIGDLLEKAKQTVTTAGQSIQSGLQTAAPMVKPILGAGLNIFSPALGALANTALQGTNLEGMGGAAAGIAQNIGNLLSQPKKTAGENIIPPGVAQAVTALIAPAQGSIPLDNRDESKTILDLLKNMTTPTTPDVPKPSKTMKIFGKEIKVWVFWVSLVGVILVITVVIILIVRARRKKKKELPAK